MTTKNYNSFTWKVAQYLRSKGVLAEGWNPYTDRYEYRLFGIVYDSKKFVSFDTKTHPYANVKPKSETKDIVLFGTGEVKQVKVPKEVGVDPLPFPQAKGYEVLLPNGSVLVYPSMGEACASLKRAWPYFGKYVRMRSTTSEKIIMFVKNRTGLEPSQLGCDPAERFVVRNRQTGANISRPVTPMIAGPNYKDFVAKQQLAA
jgi:hypothetical protein